MARKCVVTGRKTSTGNLRSHAMNSNKRKWKANVQKVRIMVDGKPKKFMYLLAHLNQVKLNAFNIRFTLVK